MAFSIAFIIALLLKESVWTAILCGTLAEMIWDDEEGHARRAVAWLGRWPARRKRAKRRAELMKMRVGSAIPPTTVRLAPEGHTDEELRRIEEELDAELSGELPKKKGTSLTGPR